MKNVMTIAWGIAKEAVLKFGGKAKEYFAASLKLAWAQVKNVATDVVIELSEGSRKHKTWVAEIVGTDAKWGFKREFLNARESATEKGKWFDLEEGKVYDVNGYSRSFFIVRNGQTVELSADEVKAVIA